MTETYVKEEVAWRTMVKVPFSNSFLERRDARRKFSEFLGAGASLAPRTRQRADHLDPTMTEGSGAVRARKRRAWAWEWWFRLRQTSIEWDKSDSEETIWDPISSLGRVMPPSDFVLDSSRSSFSQTKKNCHRKDFYHVPQHHKP